MEGKQLELGSRLELDAAESVVVDAFLSQRLRLLAIARTLSDAEWTSATRCSEWDAHALVMHVVGATDACRDTLTGEHPVFVPGFDPNASPNEFVDLHAGTPTAALLDLFDVSIITVQHAIGAQQHRTPPLKVGSVWGEPIDWRLFIAHFFFDGWIHERDLLLPLDRDPVISDAEARLVTAYALHIAAIVAGGFGIPLDVSLNLGGSGAGTFRIAVDGFDALVSVGPFDSSGVANGDAVAVTDAIAGRGVGLDTVLHAAPEVVDALSGVGAFLQG